MKWASKQEVRQEEGNYGYYKGNPMYGKYGDTKEAKRGGERMLGWV